MKAPMTKVQVNLNPDVIQEELHSIGNWYKRRGGSLWLLASVSGKAVLVGTGGDFWNNPVDYVDKVDNKTWLKVQGEAGQGKFTLVKNITITEE